MTWPLNESEAGVDLVLIQTSLLLLCKSSCLHDKSSEVCIKTRSTPASLSFKGQVTEQITVKWSIVFVELLSQPTPPCPHKYFCFPYLFSMSVSGGCCSHCCHGYTPYSAEIHGLPILSSTIDLYHAAAILSPRGTKSFVFAGLASH